MTANVVSLHANPLLSKKQLAVEIGRSERWIELRQREGLPVADTDRYGRRRYRLKDVEAWLHDRSGRPQTAADRIAALEARVASLTATVEQLQRRAG